MEPKRLCFFYIDDIIWTLRELTRTMPKSLFDIPFMKLMKKRPLKNVQF